MTGGPGVEVLRRWDARALATETTTPAGSAAVVLMWTDVDAADAGPGPATARAVATALAHMGPVAYRWRSAPPAGTRQIGALASRGGWTVVEALDPAAAASLFEEGWALGDQLALIGAPDARALDLLSRRDLRRTELQDEEVLLAATVDGAGALVATASAARLAQATDAILTALLGVR